MASFSTTEAQKLTSTSTASAATFGDGTVGGIQELYIAADADCFISFDDQIPVVSGAGLLIKANQKPTRIVFGGGSIKKVWAISSGSSNVYLLGVRH